MPQANVQSVTGFPQAFPIFQTYLTSGTLAKHRDSTVLALLAPGLQGILQGILFQVLPKRPRYHRTLVLVGISTIVLAMFLASCAVRPWQILLTQGVLFGMGAVLLNYVHVSIFPEWFDKKKGQAMGIIWLGWRVGGLGFPLISQWLLDRHGYEATVRSLIAPMVALLVPAIVLFRGRFSAASVEIAPVQPPLSTMRALQTPNVFFYLLVSILNESVTNVPTMFMMQYGADLGLSTSDQALSLSLRVLGMMVGTYVLSWLSDSISFEVLMVVSGVSTSLVHLLVWGFAKDRFGFFAYAVAVGLTSGGCTIQHPLAFE
jgi:MFS family permease